MPKSGSVVKIDVTQNCDIHCKAYVQESLDRAIKAYQANQIETTGYNVTYSEAVRRLILIGLQVEDETIEIKGEQ